MPPRVRQTAELAGLFPAHDALTRRESTDKDFEQEDVVLALFLANEKLKLDGGEPCEWAPWIRLLPSS